MVSDDPIIFGFFGAIACIIFVICSLPFFLVWLSLFVYNYEMITIKKGIKVLYKQNNLLIIKTRNKGVCVIANRHFKAGDIITKNVTIPVSQDDKLTSDWNMDSGYEGRDSLALGEINLMNHDDNSNVAIDRSDLSVFVAIAKRDIPLGEELCIQYECSLWFKPLPMLNLKNS